jgi:hypothetical protein
MADRGVTGASTSHDSGEELPVSTRIAGALAVEGIAVYQRIAHCKAAKAAFRAVQERIPAQLDIGPCDKEVLRGTAIRAIGYQMLKRETVHRKAIHTLGGDIVPARAINRSCIQPRSG